MAKVLGIPLYNKSIEQACKHAIAITRASDEKHCRCVSATGAHGMVHAYQTPEFHSILNQFYWNLPDGMPGVWVSRLKGEKEIKRCYGPAFFEELMTQTASLPINHYLCGGKEGVADELRKACIVKFGNANIVGTYCPPFRELTDAEWQTLSDDITAKKADVVWIGLSTPKQEVFAYQLAKLTQTHFIMTVGAAFDFHTDKITFAPEWMQNAGLEWLFRLFSEPRRLYKRYLKIVPLFIIYNLKEFFNHLLKKLNLI